MSQRRQRSQRLSNPPYMRLTERDREIIAAVHHFRVLRQDQLQSLFFGSQSAAQRVLVRLYDHGFLERKFLPVVVEERGGRSPTLYVLDRRGAELLRAEAGYTNLAWYPTSKALSPDFLAHTLAINDFRVAITVACREPGYDLATWLGENELKADYDRVTVRAPSGRSRTVSVIPDSYFTITTPRGTAPFFLELDRGTMELSRFKTKVEAYLTYRQNGGYERRFGYKSLRVLTVTPGPRRLENLIQAASAAGGSHPFWFALATDLTPETVLTAPVWRVLGRDEQSALIPTV